MTHFIAYLASAGVILSASHTLAMAQTVPELLAQETGNVVIDAMPEAQRNATVRGLAAYLGSDTRAAARMLCLIRPWHTGDAAEDGALRQKLRQLMAQETSVESPAFRWLDCAASNGPGGYREVVLDPMDDLRASFCTTRPDLAERQRRQLQIIAGIMAFDAELAAGMGNATLRSYYPPRNALRLANLRAGLAVAAEQSGDDGAARGYLAQAVAGLKTARDGLSRPEDIASTRNGWRLRADLDFYLSFYQWLEQVIADQAPVPPEYALPQPAAKDPLNADAIAPELRAQMGPDYRDTIYVERLLPGAQFSGKDAGASDRECRQWRRRSYAPAALKEAWEGCADQTRLQDVDRCLSDFQAQDWTLRFATVQPHEDLTASEGEVHDYLKRVQNRLREQPGQDDLATRVGRIESLPIGETGVHVIQSRGLFTTAEHDRLIRIFEQIQLYGLRPQFRRPVIY